MSAQIWNESPTFDPGDGRGHSIAEVDIQSQGPNGINAIETGLAVDPNRNGSTDPEIWASIWEDGTFMGYNAYYTQLSRKYNAGDTVPNGSQFSFVRNETTDAWDIDINGTPWVEYSNNNWAGGFQPTIFQDFGEIDGAQQSRSGMGDNQFPSATSAAFKKITFGGPILNTGDYGSTTTDSTAWQYKVVGTDTEFGGPGYPASAGGSAQPAASTSSVALSPSANRLTTGLPYIHIRT